MSSGLAYGVRDLFEVEWGGCSYGCLIHCLYLAGLMCQLFHCIVLRLEEMNDYSPEQLVTLKGSVEETCNALGSLYGLISELSLQDIGAAIVSTSNRPNRSMMFSKFSLD